MSSRTKRLERSRKGRPTPAVRLVLTTLLLAALATSDTAAVEYIRDLKPLLRVRREPRVDAAEDF